jgi:predicted Zn-dependent protease
MDGMMHQESLDQLVAFILRDSPQNILPPPIMEALRSPTLESLHDTAAVLVAQQHTDVAEKLYSALLDYPGSGPWVYAGLAKIAESRNEWSAVAKIWQDCFTRFPDRLEPRWFIEYAKAEHLCGNDDAAEAALRDAAGKFPASAPVAVAHAEQLGKQGRLEACLVAWQQTIETFEQTAYAWWFMELARIAGKLGKSAIAESALSQCRARFPDFAPAAVGLAEHLAAQGPPEACLAAWQLVANHFGAQIQPRWLVELARAELRTGLTAAAEAHLRQCVADFPDFFAAQTALADCLQTLSRPEEAIRIWRSTISAFPQSAQPWWFLRYADASRAIGDEDAAESILSMMDARFPDAPVILIRQAEAAAKQGAWQMALDRWTVCEQKLPAEKRPECWNGQATALYHLNQIDAALARWRRLVQEFPGYTAGQLSFARICRELGDWRQVEQIIGSLLTMQAHESKVDLRVEYARSLLHQGSIAAASRAIQDIDERFSRSPHGCHLSIEFCYHIGLGVDALLPEIQAALRRFPEDRYIMAESVRALLATGRASEAEAAARRMLSKSHDHYGILSFWRVIMDRNGEAALQWPVSRAIQEQNWDANAGLVMGNFLLDLWAPWAAECALELFTSLLQHAPANMSLICAKARAHIALRQDELGLNLIDSLPALCQTTQCLELRAWAAMKRENNERARELYASALRHLYFPSIHAPTPDLICLSTNSLPSGTVTAFTSIYNEMANLPAFLAHYRRLGVSRFVVVDTMSKDEGAAYLQAQPDVILYQTTDLFQSSGSGMRWINILQDRHGDGGWCVYADADEALIYPGWETIEIGQFTAYLDRQGVQAVAAFMLDMYPDRLVDAQGRPAERDSYRYYDGDYQWMGQTRAPYLQPVGGIRWRLFGVHEVLHKVPLMRHRAGQYLSSHTTTPMRFADITAVLLHYKLMNLASRFKPTEHGIGGNPFMLARTPDLMRRHVRYAERMEDLLQKDLYQPGLSETLDSSLVLADRGLMQAPATFRQWIKESA